MMKSYICIFFFLMLLSEISFCQFQYATPNITKGSVTCKVVTKSISKQENKIVSQSVTEVEFSTSILFAFAYTAEDLTDYNKKIKSLKRLPLIVVANNFLRTFDENESIVNAHVPRFPTSVSYMKDEWTIDPCNKGNDELTHSLHEEGSGQVQDPLRGVSLSLEGLKDDIGFYMVKIYAGGGWGKIKDIPLSAKVYKPDVDDPDNKCKWQNLDGDMFYSLNAPTVTQIFLSGTDLPKGYKGTNGKYTYTEDHSFEDLITNYEYDFFKIDTMSLFNYLRELPPFKQFKLTATYNQISKSTTHTGINTEESTEQCILTINLGEIKNELTLSTPNEDEYHDWLPFRKDEDGYMPLQVKAVLKSEDPEPKDTIHLYLKDVSHYTGFCTNYPLKDKNIKPDNTADIRFAKNQSDPNVEYIDTFHVKTKKKVESATVDVECYDYAGYAKLEARAVMKNVKGYSKYDNIACLILPEDKNENHIADKWEKDVGVYDKNLKEKDDGDEYPKDQKDEGDGYTLFEEYRGFYSDKDFCKADKNNKRSGKFIRTDPNWKDIFIYDDTKDIFENQYVPSNSADLNWHLVGNGQIKYVPAAKINAMLPGPYDNVSSKLISMLIENDHRWINYNTPNEFSLGKHYGLFIFFPDRLNGTQTAGCSTPGTVDGSTVSICQFIEYQRYAPFEKAIFDFSPFLVSCVNYPQCPYRCISGKISSSDLCPKCHSQLKSEKYFTDAELVKLAKILYEGTAIHEIGHALGISHHGNGVAKFTDNAGVKHDITGKNLGSFTGEDLVNADYALARLGSLTCAMRYNFVSLGEFRTKQILTRTNKYCRAGETYLDDYGKPQKSDNCFGKITVK